MKGPKQIKSSYMAPNKFYNTGFNPDINAHFGTSKESPFYEITAKKDNLSALMMNEQVVFEEVVYPTDEMIIDSDTLIPVVD